jgi:hypothetical protein
LSFLFIGASIHACRKAGRHIAAMEDDGEIFKSLLQPLIVHGVSEGLKKQRIHAGHTSVDNDDEEVEEVDEPMIDIVPRNRFCA